MTTEDNSNLQEGNAPDTIGEAQGDAQQAAGVEAPEDTASAYLRTIAEQQDTIKDLLGQVSSLNSQMASFARSMGSHVSQEDDPDKAANVAAGLPDDYVYLKDLGKDIGKRD